MHKSSLIAVATVVMAVMYWMEYTLCYQKAHALDENIANLVGSVEATTTFTHYLLWFTVVGLLMPGALILAVVLNYIYNVPLSEVDDHISVFVLTIFYIIVMVTLFSMIFMVPFLMEHRISRIV